MTKETPAHEIAQQFELFLKHRPARAEMSILSPDEFVMSRHLLLFGQTSVAQINSERFLDSARNDKS